MRVFETPWQAISDGSIAETSQQLSENTFAVHKSKEATDPMFSPVEYNSSWLLFKGPEGHHGRYRGTNDFRPIFAKAVNHAAMSTPVLSFSFGKAPKKLLRPKYTHIHDVESIFFYGARF